MKEIIALWLFLVGLVIKEIWNSNGREKLHQRIDELDKKFVTEKLCDERSGEIKSDLKEIKEDVKELLRRNGGERHISRAGS